MTTAANRVEGREDRYGQDYLAWKDWNAETFGMLQPQVKAGFKAEMRRAGLASGDRLDVLEIGFGNGAFLAYAKARGWNVTGLEVNEPLVETAKRNGFSAFCGNLAGFADNSFDLVVAFDVLEHVPQAEMAGLLAEVERVLRGGGLFIARFPNGDSPFGLVHQNGDVTHVTAIGSVKAEYFALNAGAQIVHLGSEAMPILAGHPVHTVHRLVAMPIRHFLNFVFRLLYFPRSRVSFFSPNLTMILRFPARPTRRK